MKKIKIIFTIFVIFIFVNSYANAKLRDEKSEKLDKLRMTPSTFDKMKNLHKNTYYTAVKAIIGKLGNILYKELPFSEKRLLAKCLDKVEDRRELIEPAKCVVTARKRLLKIKAALTQKHLEATTPHPNRNWKAFLQQFDDFDRLHGFSPVLDKKDRFLNSRNNNGVIQNGRFSSRLGKYRKPKKDGMIKQKNRSSEVQPLTTPRRKSYNKFNFLNQKLTAVPQNTISNPTKYRQSKKLANLPRSRRFQKFMYRAKRSSRFSDSKDHYYKEKHFKVISKSEFSDLTPRKHGDHSFISSITNVIREFTTNATDIEKGKEHLKWTKTYNRLMRVRKAIDEQKRVPGAKVYEHRMYDLVLGREEASLAPSERRSTQGIMHEAMQLLGRLTSTSNESAPYYRALSPRFMPLMPLNEGKRQPETYLSPNIMAMYEEPNDRKILQIGNVPQVMKTLGVAPKDRNKIMQLVMDLSGSNVHIDEALKIYENLGMFDGDIGEPLLNATERILGAFKYLEKSLFPDQKFELCFYQKHQMQKLLRDQGVAEDSLDLADFDIYDQMTDEQMELSLWKTLENIAANNTNVIRPSEVHRYKRNYITYLSPTILSPLLFTVQFGAVVLGPLILSPAAFAPPILNPSVLAPWILSPGIFDPFVLSPYIFGPFVLGPFAFTPFILTPYFLSPNVLNPYLITSLILSPLGLCPDILSPMAIGANILSPSVLSPPVLNPTVLTASVLSPSFLS